MPRLSTDSSDDQQPLLSDTQDPPKPLQQQHWLERLIFGSRRRFYISVGVFFLIWTGIGLFLNPASAAWPWKNDPDYFGDVGFQRAKERLRDQPFCLPSVGLLEAADVLVVHDSRNHVFEWAEGEFDKLAGSKVRTSRQWRDQVEVVMSITHGQPFYTRTANSETAIKTADTFQSRVLYEAVKELSQAASITPQDLTRDLQLNDTRVIRDERHGSSLLETTLSDTQQFVQSLIAIYHGLSHPTTTSLLDPAVVGDYLSPLTLSTDGSTSTTRSPFALVRQELSRFGGSSLVSVGPGFGGSFNKLQRHSRPLDLHVISEIGANHELSVAFNLERGLVVTVLAHLTSDPQKEQRAEDSGDGVWDWMRSWFPNVVYSVEWRREARLKEMLAGTYRYERNASLPHGEVEWIEVDVEVEERGPWITRIESSSTSVSAPVSLLRKYNVGGTADFFPGWTCQHEIGALYDCYRPRMGEDDSKCSCRTGHPTTRVGLWPSVADHGGMMVYEIPQGAIRRDEASYMDQGLGGCPAIWRADEGQSVPEMDVLGYKVRFTEPNRRSDGRLIEEAELTWLDSGIKMVRIRGVEKP